MKLISTFISLIFISCGSTSGVKKTNDLSSIYITSDVSQYFHPDIPNWANFSSAASCSRTSTIRFMNFTNLKRSFNFDYNQALQLQYRINENFHEAKVRVRKNFLSPQIEEKLFYQSKDEVVSNIKTFPIPDFKRVHLVWVDPVFSDKKALNKLKTLFKQDSFFQGHPVFVSVCKTRQELEEFTKSNGWTDVDIRYVSGDMFSVYREDLEFDPKFQLYINKLFPNKMLYLFLLTKQEPIVLNGSYRTVK